MPYKNSPSAAVLFTTRIIYIKERFFKTLLYEILVCEDTRVLASRQTGQRSSAWCLTLTISFPRLPSSTRSVHLAVGFTTINETCSKGFRLLGFVSYLFDFVCIAVLVSQLVVRKVEKTLAN